MPQPVIGCDLSRAFLDLCDLPSGRTQRIPNTRDAVAEWVETLAPDILVVFEATSGCDDILIATLTERAHPFSRVRPASSPAQPTSWPRPTVSMPTLIAVVHQLLVIRNAMIQKRQPLQIT